MGRHPEGPELARRLEGPEEAKQRLEAILGTVAGRLTIDEACASLGIRPARFHELRQRALEAACEALAPRAAGRPRLAPDVEDEEVRALRQRNQDLLLELRAAEVREALARSMPHVLRGACAGKGGSALLR